MDPMTDILAEIFEGPERGPTIQVRIRVVVPE